ncbi:MAG: CRISPR-associated helicase Cas3' [bacterium]
MDFFSHCKLDENNNVLEKKYLWQHLQNAANIAKNNFSNNINFSSGNNVLIELIDKICMLHDLGKYTSFFQKYLFKEKVEDSLRFHASIGAYTLFNLYKNINPKLAVLSYFIIKSHHKNLIAIVDDPVFSDMDVIVLNNIFKQQKQSLSSIIEQIEKELNIPNLKNYLVFPENADRLLHKEIKRKPNIENYFLVNYLFSLLIEADKLDASNTKQYNKVKIDNNSVTKYLDLLPKNLSNINRIRSEIRETIKAQISTDLLKHKIFTLTSPTGSGKTLLSLEFAINLRNLIRQTQNKEVQIIYSLPFINIIQQTELVLNDVFADNVKILSHYQYSSIFDAETVGENGANYNQQIQHLETWQCDIIITSFVQLLQTLIGNKNKFLKKFHHLANSIIILDEVQALKAEHLPLIGSVIYFLTEFLNSTVLLMTATKPIIFELANKFILCNENAEAKPYELLPNNELYFKQFNRTQLIPYLDNVLDIYEFFELFKSIYKPDCSCLIVCNKISTSLEIYEVIRDFVDENKNNIYYLSTNLLPADRDEILNNIRLDLKQNKKPLLVSTQVIEAGVDLDFDMGFRDIGPLDSIIQAAGRINRNCKKDTPSPFYIIDLGNCTKIYGSIVYSTVKKLLTTGTNIQEINYLDLIKNYYYILSNKSKYDESENIFNSIKNLNYYKDGEKDTIADFKVIDEKAFSASVFIETDDTAKFEYSRFCDFIDKKITKEDFNKYKKDFNKRVLEVPKTFINNQLKSRVQNLYYISNDIIDYYYNKQTGFIRKDKDVFL